MSRLRSHAEHDPYGAISNVQNRTDVTTYLTLWIVLLCGISGFQVVRGFGAIGSPATLIALPTFFLWAAGWVLPYSGLNRSRNPLRPALVGYLAYLIISFAVAMSRSLTELEMTGAIRALLIGTAMVGLALLVTDGVTEQHRLETFLRRLMFGISFVAALGILEFFTGSRLFDFTLPGMEWNRDLGGVGTRSLFNRPSSTTMHPIELSVITAAALPLAIHFARYGDNAAVRRRATIASGVIGLAIPMAVSRSGILSLAVALLVMFAGWDGRTRIKSLTIMACAVPLLWAAIPGLVGTLISLFTQTGTDPSVQARIQRVPRIMEHVRERPVLGLGNGTWSVEEYFLLDNEFYSTVLHMGYLGFIVVLVVILLGIAVSVTTRCLPSADESTRHLALALAAGIASLSVSIATFDSFFYRILTGMLFALIGAAGALWQILANSNTVLVKAMKP